ncbi:hypothetical protein CABS01_01638 [Colletotrichum abscissum]|uniref:Uncharacterized protein n=2 Tax=Colletotrichum acutatum species complex TaxID=2707335 RepID=A0AAJ0E408_9PEZI|nr:uncharacterized protein CCOS01_06178 [Colletotrichum costaricense]XP_060398207.1 uncharacterized protein CABS01_01638 [Colletotrichum abscissum]KAI3546066.1 hypothetical protein CSPX01_04562 [Colletotrichum filicis]KAK1465357.1 hypothetical protein CCUS01_07765 [Colletotrichum cuscutae]KAK1495831.1 hypothetical protein CABS01_01638 [Colletotrichum abscissum]KAK1531075.1 hypothetical protein CCOS01_06178 [Colletotrichum costaricense]
MRLKKLDHLWRYHSILSVLCLRWFWAVRPRTINGKALVSLLPSTSFHSWLQQFGDSPPAFFSGIWKRQFGKPVEYFRGQTLRWYNQVTCILRLARPKFVRIHPISTWTAFRIRLHFFSFFMRLEEIIRSPVLTSTIGQP